MHTMSRIRLDNNTSNKTSLFTQNHSLLSYFSVSHFTCLAHFIFKRAFKKAVWGELLNVPPDNDLRFHQTCFSATACGARGLRLLETQNAHARARMHIKWRDSGRLGAAKRIVIYCALIWMPSIVCGLAEGLPADSNFCGFVWILPELIALLFTLCLAPVREKEAGINSGSYLPCQFHLTARCV